MYLFLQVEVSKINCTSSYAIHTGLNIEQGSTIGPMLYIAMKYDLHPLSKLNILIQIFKYVTLHIPEHIGYWIGDWVQPHKILG